MFTIFKIIICEKFFINGLARFIMPGKFRSFLFPMYRIHALNILLVWLTSSCSSKKVVEKLKSLQPKPITDSNTTNKDQYEYPLSLTNTVDSHQNYSFETFIIIISIVLLFNFINSEYMFKVFRFFKKTK